MLQRGLSAIAKHLVTDTVQYGSFTFCCLEFKTYMFKQCHHHHQLNPHCHKSIIVTIMLQIKVMKTNLYC